MPPKSVANKKSNPQPEQKKANKGQGRNVDFKKFPQPIRAQYISNGDIRRLARRGGVRRISSDVYDLSKMYMKIDSMIYASYAGRTTLLADDICRSAKRAGQTAIGFTTSMQSHN